ncbi:MAG: PAS domain-containing protein [Candidatus Riflebacteria bacterium]|nr:PAS domain-containing protein [Candidatus Riflebacteria bacterium]
MDEITKNEAHLKDAQRIARIGSWELDIASNIIVWSDEIRRILEISPNTSGTPFDALYQVIHPEDREVARKAYTDSIRSKLPYEIDHRLLMHDGRQKLVHACGETFCDNNGNPVRSIGTLQDISPRQKISSESPGNNGSPKSDPNKKKSDELPFRNGKLEDFWLLTDGISHDFSNLLAGILGNIEMAATTCQEDSPARNYLAKARSIFDRARDLTRQLSMFSKRGIPVRKSGSLKKLFQENPRFSAGGSKISYRFDIVDDLWTCDFDENQLANAIENIIMSIRQTVSINSYVSISARNVHIAKFSPQVNAKGEYIRISIEDTGRDISPETMPQIFDPFFSTNKQMSDLGLSTIYPIILRHDGFMTIDSTPGIGSIFHIFLPASSHKTSQITSASTSGSSSPASSSHAAYPVSPGPTSASSETSANESHTVLVMDDEELLRELSTRLLERLGCKAVCVADGPQALESLAELVRTGEGCAGAILDLTIPGSMGGKEVLAEMHKIAPQLNVIAISGYSNDPVMLDPTAFGFAGKLEKPFSLNDLSNLLGRLGISKK